MKVDYIIIPVVMLAIFSLPLMMLTSAGSDVQDYMKLDGSQCHVMIINDTFIQVQGSIGANTYYYVVSDGNVYELMAGNNATKIYRWKTIVKGQSYNMKSYKNYVEFCEDKFLFNRDDSYKFESLK